ncbi:MAG: N-Acetyl-D-glucosamine ABC transport system, permease protein 2, partial [uncultured Chloroflexia bacterium]
MTIKGPLKAIPVYAVCIVISLITVGPFLWMVSTSFKLPTEATVLPPEWIPSPFTWESYRG